MDIQFTKKEVNLIQTALKYFESTAKKAIEDNILYRELITENDKSIVDDYNKLEQENAIGAFKLREIINFAPNEVIYLEDLKVNLENETLNDLETNAKIIENAVRFYGKAIQTRQEKIINMVENSNGLKATEQLMDLMRENKKLIKSLNEASKKFTEFLRLENNPKMKI